MTLTGQERQALIRAISPNRLQTYTTAAAQTGCDVLDLYVWDRDLAAAAMASYGWLGAKTRPADNPSGITLMGVRLYNPTTGRFLSVDPVRGGGANDYAYPTDPINMYDLDGNFWGEKKLRRARRMARSSGRWVGRNRGNIYAVGALAGYASCPFTFGAGCAVGGGFSAASFADSAVTAGYNCGRKSRRKRHCSRSAVNFGVNSVSFGIGARFGGLRRSAWPRLARRYRWRSTAIGLGTTYGSLIFGHYYNRRRR